MIRSQLSFDVQFLEPWHIGTGYGRAGDVDSAQYCEVSAGGVLIPRIKIDELKGLLKEGCEKAIKARIAFNSPDVQKLRETQRLLFPVENSGRGNFLPSIDIFQLSSQDKGLTRRRQTSIAPTGQALKRSLRSYELGNAKALFKMRLSVTCCDKTFAQAACSLLNLGLRNIPEIGMRTNRGWGSVKIDVGQPEFLDLSSARRPDIVERKRYLIMIRLLDDITFSDGPMSGNLFRSFGYMPGSGAFGMLRAALKQCDDKNLGFDFGRISVSPFYPWPITTDGKLPLCLPFTSPLTLRKAKGTDRLALKTGDCGIPYWALGELEDRHLNACVSRDQALPSRRQNDENSIDKSFGESFIWPTGEDPHDWLAYSAPMELENRNHIDPLSGTTPESGLYLEERIRKGTILGGMISTINNDKEIVDCLSRFPDGFIFHCGRGARPAELLSIQALDDDLLIPPTPKIEDEYITVTLLSDCIISTKNNPGKAPRTIQPMLTNLEKELEPLGQVASTRFINTWETGKGPRNRALAFQAGSVFVFRIKETRNSTPIGKKLAVLQADGIGMRRDEGFGRIWINCPIHRSIWGRL